MAVERSTTSITQRSDEQLITRYLAEGERVCLEVLFQRYRETAFRVAWRLLGNESDALDAVQEGFIKVLKRLRGFEHRSSFKTWLLRIVSNAALDLGRQRNRRDELHLSYLRLKEQENGSTALPGPNDKLQQSDLRHALDAALLELPEPQRQAFILHVDGGLSYREIAAALGISIGTVMSRLFYARQKLKVLLAASTTA